MRGLVFAVCAANCTTIWAGCAAGSATDAAASAEQPAPAVSAAPGPAGTEPVGEADPDSAEPDLPFAPPTDLPDDYLAFDGACDAGRIVTIAAVGDLLIHRELQRQAYKAKDRYINLWAGIADLLAKTDLTYGNLEGPTAKGINRKGELVADPGLRFDNSVYSGYARFNYHPSLARDLIKTGFDVVSTANNHSLDRDALGVDRTLDALDKAGLRHTGTRRQNTKHKWHAVTETEGMRVAWLACTKHTNFSKDELNQVLGCYKDRDNVAKLVARLAKNKNIDAVIVTPHWGTEYSHVPTDRQRKFAQRLADAGATAIIGSHPHVLQPWEKILAGDREVFVHYSLGNFASHQRTLNRRSTMLLYLGLRQSADGTVVPVGARYVPLHVRMVGEKEKFFVEAIDRAGGPADSRALTVGMFGTSNLMAPDDKLVVNPHCFAGWKPAG